MFRNLAPYRASATESTLTPSLEYKLHEKFYVAASYALTFGSNDAERYTVQAFYLGATYELSR
jgi:hypothetical protein